MYIMYILVLNCINIFRMNEIHIVLFHLNYPILDELINKVMIALIILY